MRSKYHVLITKEAIGEFFSPNNLNTILTSNINQDCIIGLLGHDEFHFDNNKFSESYAYLKSQKYLCVQAIVGNKTRKALKAFGRMCHSVQDFYAHSNYIQLWINNLNEEAPSLSNLNCIERSILNSKELVSHQTTFPGDYLALIPGVDKLLKPYLPKSSHTNMNLDSPTSGDNFYWAYHSAVVRTKIELEKVIGELHCFEKEISHFLVRKLLRN